MTAIWYEVLPVTFIEEHPVLIRHRQEKQLPPWMIQNQPHIHPNELVISNLVNFFGAVFVPSQTIVHSTSWRYEYKSDQLLLTYLAVLPQGKWIEEWAISDRIYTERIEEGGIQCGDHLLPPEQIQSSYVLAHALDHLAALNTYDQAIQAVLEPRWKELLRSRTPKPAGYLLATSRMEELSVPV